jgi:signal transduction histidine kinase
VRGALQSALAELRAISAGLRLPELGNLGLVETAQRAVREYERKTGVAVSLKAADLPVDAPLPAKITLYRLLQEALNNGFRHAGGAGQAVRIACGDHRLEVEVRDSGPGFDPMAAREEGHLGLAVMRERVEVLGGKFAVETDPGRGTRVLAEIPLEWLPGESE